MPANRQTGGGGRGSSGGGFAMGSGRSGNGGRATGNTSRTATTKSVPKPISTSRTASAKPTPKQMKDARVAARNKAGQSNSYSKISKNKTLLTSSGKYNISDPWSTDGSVKMSKTRKLIEPTKVSSGKHLRVSPSRLSDSQKKMGKKMDRNNYLNNRPIKMVSKENLEELWTGDVRVNTAKFRADLKNAANNKMNRQSNISKKGK